MGETEGKMKAEREDNGGEGEERRGKVEGHRDEKDEKERKMKKRKIGETGNGEGRNEKKQNEN